MITVLAYAYTYCVVWSVLFSIVFLISLGSDKANKK